MAEISPAPEGRRVTTGSRVDRPVPDAQQTGVQWYSDMRIALLALGIIAVGLLAAAALVGWPVEVPPVGPGVEQICAETMQRTEPDPSWVAPGREEKVRRRAIKTVTLGELPSHSGSLVRVAGLSDDSAGQEMLAEFTKLYETGEF